MPGYAITPDDAISWPGLRRQTPADIFASRSLMDTLSADAISHCDSAGHYAVDISAISWLTGCMTLTAFTIFVRHAALIFAYFLRLHTPRRATLFARRHFAPLRFI